jgi:hypothetical protein
VVQHNEDNQGGPQVIEKVDAGGFLTLGRPQGAAPTGICLFDGFFGCWYFNLSHLEFLKSWSAGQVVSQSADRLSA